MQRSEYREEEILGCLVLSNPARQSSTVIDLTPAGILLPDLITALPAAASSSVLYRLSLPLLFLFLPLRHHLFLPLLLLLNSAS